MVGQVLTPTHLLLVLAVALLVLGPKRLPAAGRGLGEAMRGFKDALASGDRRDTADGQISEERRIMEASDAARTARRSHATPHPTALSPNDVARSEAIPDDASSKSSSTNTYSDPLQRREPSN